MASGDEEKIGNVQITFLNVVNLNAVTSATEGSSVDIRKFKSKVAWVNVSVNTGAVTVKVEVSPDNSTWFERFSQTYTATTPKDLFETSFPYAYMRITTTTHSNATVTATITGQSF